MDLKIIKIARRPPKHIGDHAEKVISKYLQSKNMILREKNYRCYHGEIDLVMRENQTIVFVEVRLRSRVEYGSPIETLSANKQKRLTKTALHYLQRHRLLNNTPCRFDFVGINQNHQIRWIKNVFPVQ